jgi:acyl carrier protein
MEKHNIIIHINEIFIEILGHKQFHLNENTMAKDVDGWDSITHLMIISDLEKRFAIKFKLMELMNMETIGDLISTIENKL